MSETLPFLYRQYMAAGFVDSSCALNNRSIQSQAASMIQTKCRRTRRVQQSAYERQKAQRAFRSHSVSMSLLLALLSPPSKDG